MVSVLDKKPHRYISFHPYIGSISRGRSPFFRDIAVSRGKKRSFDAMLGWEEKISRSKSKDGQGAREMHPHSKPKQGVSCLFMEWTCQTLPLLVALAPV